MSLRRQKKIEIIINFLDDKLLKNKLNHDSEFIDTFIIINLSYPRQRKKKKLIDNLLKLTSKQVYFQDIRIDTNLTWKLEFKKILSFCREKILNLDYDLDDILFFSKSNEFLDFEQIDKSLYSKRFTILNHRKIFWDKFLSDNKFVMGAIVTRVSSIINDSIFDEIDSIFHDEIDKFEHTQNRNGYVFVGLNDIPSLLKQIKYKFVTLQLDNLSEDSLIFYRENLLPLENLNLLETKSLSAIKLPKNFSKVIRKKTFNTESKVIKINLTNGEVFDKNQDVFYVNLKLTSDLRKNLYFDGSNFFIYDINGTIESSDNNKLLYLNVKKASELFFPKSKDIVHIISHNKTEIYKWDQIDDVIFGE